MPYKEQTLTVGPTHDQPARVFMQAGGGKWWERLGYILKFGKKSWAWDSFKSRPYLSDAEHAETFPSIEAARRWAAKHKIVGQVTELVTDGLDPWSHMRAAMGRDT